MIQIEYFNINIYSGNWDVYITEIFYMIIIFNNHKISAVKQTKESYSGQNC